MDSHRPVGGVGRGVPVNQNLRAGFGNEPSGFGGAGFGADRTNFGADSNSNSGFGSGGGNRGGDGCRNCGETGHFARDCPQRGRRPNSGEGGFGNGNENFGSGFGGGRGGGGKSDGCRKCGEDGHFARDCPKGGGSGGQPRTCRKCGGEGHIARDCTQEGGLQGFGGGSGGFGSDGAGFGGGGAGGGFGGGGAGGGFGGGGGRPRTCHKCGKEGHMARDCTEEGDGGFGGSNGGGFGGGGGGVGASVDGAFGGGDDSQSRPRSGGCRKCGEEGHFARDCPKGGNNSGACFNCGETGHISKECPNPRKEGAGGGRSSGPCFRCGQEGHMSKDCTNEAADARKPASTHVPVEVAEDVLWEEHIPAGINFDRYYDIAIERSGCNCDSSTIIQTFDEAGLTPRLLENVKKAGYTRPTPIQQHAIPIIMAGRDMMGCARTGSGKTAAFMLPILTGMMKSGDMTSQFSERQEPSAIVMAPTRELAIQIKDEARKFAIGTMAKVVVAYGGTSMRNQMDTLKNGCNVLVATPGRLLDILSRGHIGLGKCKYLVLDEADRMLDMGFEQDVRKLVTNSEMPPKTQRQTLMFSATFPSEVQQLAQDFLNDHVFITVGKIGAANEDIVQEFVRVEMFAEKKDKVMDLIASDMKNAQDEKGRYTKKTLVFVERKRTADFLATLISESANHPTTSIHGDREQKQREEALSDFRKGVCPILVATGVAARGLDIKGVDHVINFDLPKLIDDYVHRIGRTGRVGNPGRATSLFDVSTDGQIAGALLTVLADAHQNVPDWLQEAAGVGGGASFAGETAQDSGLTKEEW